MVYEILNSIEGVSCNEVMGAMYAFPKINLPKKAIDQAEVSIILNVLKEFSLNSMLLIHKPSHLQYA